MQQVDLDYRNHLQAFLNFAVKAEKRSGKNNRKPVYSKFKQFFDYVAAQNEARGKKQPSRFAGVAAALKKKEGARNG